MPKSKGPSAHRKAYREQLRTARDKRKELVKADIARREERNKKLVREGRFTPWEWSKRMNKTAKADKRPFFAD